MGKSEYQKLKDLKKSAKKEMFERCYKVAANKTPLLVILGPNKQFEDEMSYEKFMQLLEGLLVLNIKVIVITDDEPGDTVKHPAGKIYWVNTKEGRNQKVISNYLDAADMVLAFDEERDSIEDMMLRGCVIIGNEKLPLVENYKPNEETGNAFTFKSQNPWDIFRAIVRATETYMFPFDWQHIMRGLIKKD